MALAPFQTVIDAHGRIVHRFLVARVGAVDADDLWQETFLAALRAYPRLSADANVRSWLMTIAHHKAIDHARARARHPVAEGDLVARAAQAIADPAPDAGGDPVWAQVAELPEKRRAAIALRFLGDLSHAEIAAAMSISEAAARRNVHEGLNQLRERMSR